MSDRVECDYSTCEAPKGASGITNCIHCGGELIQVGSLWYHWTGFDSAGNLIDGAQSQDYVTKTTSP